MFVLYFLSNNSCIGLIGVKWKLCSLAFNYSTNFESIIIFWKSFTGITVHHASIHGWMEFHWAKPGGAYFFDDKHCIVATKKNPQNKTESLFCVLLLLHVFFTHNSLNIIKAYHSADVT